MSLIPWRYDNPYSSGEERSPVRWFCLAGRRLAVRQDFDRPIGLADGNTGLRLWSSGFLLASLIDRRAVPELASGGGGLRGRQVLELGAGCGLASLVCACLGARVTCTDIGSALPHLRRSLDANGPTAAAAGTVAAAIEVAELDWSRPDPDLLLGRDWHAVVGADLLFDAAASAALLDAVLVPLLRARPAAVCIIVYKRRGLAGEAAFLSRLAAEASWLAWRQEAVQPLPEFAEPQQHSVLVISSRRIDSAGLASSMAPGTDAST